MCADSSKTLFVCELFSVVCFSITLGKWHRRARESVVGLKRVRSLELGNATDSIFMSIIHRIERSESDFEYTNSKLEQGNLSLCTLRRHIKEEAQTPLTLINSGYIYDIPT